jgi:hypothetical protein
MASKFNSDIEDRLAAQIVDDEYSTAKRNKTEEFDDFESYIDLINSVRQAKQYDWMSDVRIPEFISHVLTQSSIDANQYFQNRDFVETYVEDEGDEALAAADASKELINRTLNQRHIHHYSKYMRAKITNNLAGKVYARCWWEQKTVTEVTGTEKTFEMTELDIEGNPLVDYENQTPAFQEVDTETTEEKILIDRFNYDVIDTRNVFLDNKYTYDLQEKDWIIIRSEKSKSSLIADKERMNYFNLDDLDKVDTAGETETSKKTYNTGNIREKEEKVKAPIQGDFDILERFGKYWCIVKEVDQNGYPVEVEPGLDMFGKVKDGAELIETIITHAVKDSIRVLIRFQPTPYISATGEPFKPIIRGLCYIHPTEDGGIGDGKHVKELQLALDDTFNIGNDRVMLATFPTLKVKKYEAEDNPEIFIAPGHNIPLDNPREDVEELAISDNIQGALAQIAFIQQQMQQLDAVYPTTMGDVPGQASTTATAVAGGESRTGMRSNYKSLTFENTYLTELYWMIQQMTYAFAKPETGEKVMGDKVFDFDPSKDYFYKPVSHAIEQEYSKQNKIKMWTQVLGYITNVQHPDTVKLLNYVLSQIFKYMGD